MSSQNGMMWLSCSPEDFGESLISFEILIIVVHCFAIYESLCFIVFLRQSLMSWKFLLIQNFLSIVSLL